MTENTNQYSKWERFVNKITRSIPDPEKIKAAQKKKWYIRYHGTILIPLMMYGLLFHPIIITKINNNIPESDIQIIDVEILNAKEYAPHIIAKLPNGNIKLLEWPVELETKTRHTYFGLWAKEDMDKLIGCKATAKISYTKYTFDDRIRVWDLMCLKTGFYVSMEDSHKQLLKSQKGILFLIMALVFFVFPFVFIVFLREKRGL
jgi:hypothetical protein